MLNDFLITNTQLSRLSQRSKIVLFGSGAVAEKTLIWLEQSKVECIVDNSESLQNSTFIGLPIRAPSKSNLDNALIIICTTAITDVLDQLELLGIDLAKNVKISPLLSNRVIIADLESISLSFYFTSGTKTFTSRNLGGGLYRCDISGKRHSLKKLYSGPCYGAVLLKDKILFVDTDKGIMTYDLLTNSIHETSKLPDGARAHGISYNSTRDSFFVTCSYRDSIIEFATDFSQSRELFISDKFSLHNSPQHHCNDNVSIENSLYVSMFSSTGNWKLDSFDGCVAEFDLETGRRLSDVATGLYMPHNIQVIEGGLHVMDSLPGHLRFSNFAVQGTFPAFARGLAYVDGFYLIGQSKNRNATRVVGLSNNISIDCGVVIFDSVSKVSRFLQFSSDIGEIHTIVA